MQQLADSIHRDNKSGLLETNKKFLAIGISEVTDVTLQIWRWKKTDQALPIKVILCALQSKKEALYFPVVQQKDGLLILFLD